MKTLEEIVGIETEPVEASEPAASDTDAAPEEAEGAEGDAAGDAPEAVRDRMVPVGALIDERRKRRAAEERLARRGAETEGAGFRDDPEGYVAALKADLAGEIAAVRVDAAESAARTRHPDFDVKAATFARIARGEPALVAAMQAAPDPAEFAYRMGARLLAGLAGTGAPGAGPVGTRPAVRGDAASLPESLSDSPSAAGPPAATWRPKPLSDIVERR